MGEDYCEDEDEEDEDTVEGGASDGVGGCKGEVCEVSVGGKIVRISRTYRLLE